MALNRCGACVLCVKDYLNELPNAGDIFSLSSLDRAMVVACKWAV